LGEHLRATLTNDPVLVRFRRALDEMHGHQLARVVLVGSRAPPDSDYDVAVFLKILPDRWRSLIGWRVCAWR
jgi:hypothetical protein